MGWSKYVQLSGELTSQDLPVAAFLILNMLRLPQTKMDVNSFFLLFFHNQTQLKLAFGMGALSELANVVFSQIKTFTSLDHVKL